jgi:hypothetical protein
MVCSPKLSTWLAFVLCVVPCLGLTGCQEAVGQLQAPVQVSLTSYLLVPGYYVNVTNLSESSITGVTVTYVWQGNSKTQAVGVRSGRDDDRGRSS